MEKNKHNVSVRALNTLENVMYAQDEYGYKKYGEPLKHTQDYDWLQMFLEEMADGLKYIQNEMDRKKSVINYLEDGIITKDWGIIEHALKLIKTKGTGKEEHNG